MNLKRIIPLCLLAALCGLFSIEVRASFVDVYISQSGAGTMDGSSCANAKPLTFFNTGGNWGGGAGQIGPATTVHLCGGLTTTLQVNGSGSAGNNITVRWEAGASVSLPASDAFELNGHSFLVFDGGSPCGPGTGCSATDTGTGIIQCTANGSGLANQLANVRAFGSSDGSGNIEIKNLIIRNIYQHTSTSDETNSIDTATNVISSSSGGASGFTGNITAHDNTIHDIGLPFQLEKFTGSPTIEMYRNYFWNVNWSVEDSGNGVRTISYHDNHDGGRSNWDTIPTHDVFHHNGLHLFQNVSSDSVSTSVYNNQFDGDWGTCCTTSFIFEEVAPPNNFLIYNNAFIQFAGNRFPLVDISSASGAGVKLLNNTFYGGGNGDPLAAGNCLKQAGSSITIENNAFLNCNQLIRIAAGSSITTVDYNLYGQQSAGGNNTFNWLDSVQTNNFAAWQAACSCDAHGAAPGGTLGLSSTGMVNPGSPAIGAATNLTGLGITSLDSDITGLPRPTGATPWTTGPYQVNTGPLVTFSPTSVAFGNQVVATSSSPTAITLTNAGSSTLTVSAVSITGANSGDFAQTNNCVGSIAAGMGCTINATFTPLATGARSASISVTDTAPGSPHTVPLSGTGTAPAVSIAPASVAFGNQAVGTSSAAVPVTVTNSGTSTLTISSVTLTGSNPGDFSEMDNCVGMVAAGMSCTVNVTFTPTTTGARSASVSVADNASGSPHTAPLTGTGTTSGASLSPTSLAFGSSLVGVSTSPQTITLTNTGGATLTISSITITGSNPGDFTRTTTCGGTLTAGSNCGISVTFTPTAAGARSASVSVADSAAGSPHTAALSGTGTSPSPSTTPAPTAIILAALPNGTVGTPYPATAFSCIGGSPPCSAWSVGPLVPGLTLSAAGVLGGTPTAAGNYALKISAVDAAGHSVSIFPALAIAAAPVAVPPVPGPPGKTPVTMSCVRTGSTSKYACTVLTWK